MYLPKSQFKKEQNTDASFLTAGGDAVTAAVTILTSFGTSLSVPSLDDLASGNFKKSEEFKIISPKLEDLLDFGLLSTKKDTIYYPTPTEEDYRAGFLDRYFVQDKRDMRIIEVSKQGYTQAKARKVFKRITLKWVIKGPADDQIIGKYMYPGAEAQNKNIVEIAERLMKGLKTYIKDYRQFVK